jgi:signal transduction histidine kinase
MDGVLDKLSIRSKIAVILILPMLGLGVLGALRVESRISTSRQADRVTKLTEFSLRGTTVAHELENERGLAERFLVATQPGQANANSTAQALKEQQRVADDAIATYRRSLDSLDAASMPQEAKDRLASALGRLNGLADMRQSITARSVAPSGALNTYNDIVTDLLNANRELGSRISDPNLSQAVGAFVSVSRIKELAALERELITGVLATGSFGPGQFRSYTSTLSTRGVLLSEFQATATPAQRDIFVRTVVGPEAQRAKELQATVVATEGNGKVAVDPNEWYRASTAEVNLLHDVEGQLGNQAVDLSKSIETSANWRAALDSLAVLVVLVLAVGLSLMVARRMLRPLRMLRASATDLATNRLPSVVSKLQHSTGHAPDLSHEMEPVMVPSRDEIGEVAAAFNTVNQVAVRVAAEQAALRMSIGDIFLNLARRSQGLIDRQLELIDELEEEADSQTLMSLFKLDHLATRMRRNAENLIVLSGAEPPRRWTEPIPLGEVARGAIGEVEDYERVELEAMEEVGVPGHAVADIIHLLSELIENATSFSPPGTMVRVGGQPTGGGYVIEVEDRGLGMSDEELLEANERLANPPTIDFAVSRVLGLFVVGRLAQRYNIRVQLRHSSYGGIIALVALPSSVVIPLRPYVPSGGPDQLGSPQFSSPRMALPPESRVEEPHPDSLPIFEQARSDWFESGTSSNGPADSIGPARSTGRPTPRPASGRPSGGGWPERNADSFNADSFEDAGAPQPTRPGWDQPEPPRSRWPEPDDRQPGRSGAGTSEAAWEKRSPSGPSPAGQDAYPPLASRFPTGEEHVRPPVSRPREFRSSFPAPMGEPLPIREARTSRSPSPPTPPHPGPSWPPDTPEPAESPAEEQRAPRWAEPPPTAQGQAARGAGQPGRAGQAPGGQMGAPGGEGLDRRGGLPRRVPRANLAPGILAQREREQELRDRLEDARRQARPPEEVRTLLANYREGIERGRRTAADWTDDDDDGTAWGGNGGGEHDEPR